MLKEEMAAAVIEALYDAALDESLWPSALESLAEATDSKAATLWVLDRAAEPRLPAFTTFNFAADFISEYLQHMAVEDPTVQYLVAHPDLAVLHDGLYLSDRDMDRLAYFDWHRRHTDMRYRLLGQIRPAPSIQAGVALHRPRSIGRYEPRDIEQFHLLYRHLERALAIGFRLGSLCSAQAGLGAALERHHAAILLLDHRHRLLYANAQAEAIVGQRDGIALGRQGPVLDRPADHHRLQALIGAATGETIRGQTIGNAAAAGSASGGIMSVPRRSGKRPFYLLVAPVSQQARLLSNWRAAVMLIITDPETAAPPRMAQIQAAFGLTPAEARLAATLATGTELRAAARALGIGYGTARTRLTEIFQKTQTRRQSELVRLLLTALPI
jgi:DNA-binding CsgD family transcriptional regulator/PAS domain-containing protein